jgi:hypothetical protein
VGMFRFFHASMHIHYSTVPPCVPAAPVTAKHDWFHFHTNLIYFRMRHRHISFSCTMKEHCSRICYER